MLPFFISKNRQYVIKDVLRFITILKNCEYARYTPSSQTSMENDYKSSVRVILELNKEI